MFTTGLHTRTQGSCGNVLYDALRRGAPLLEYECPACGMKFDVGDRVTLIPLGPGPDVEQLSRALADQWYEAVAVAVHATCAGMRDEVPPPVPDTPIGREV